ncbi:methyltransferase type 11 [Coprinopsis cinerea okayama7|uniref:Methyltransferase type 11 n=1 Tax=Coprinopsis cinerea (strain Okayama-7 / 130 / ATCC MYA-4618 / FGSC 9003) TaxID=240176 RepID=A8N6Z8_COPC7|nr:methyltransferase type 11 [Coprinopsis cinerea okayama7\|eukprot:XP_001830604.1 methyltransferase type 11 [Coprinopsis cinerea okayama7\
MGNIPSANSQNRISKDRDHRRKRTHARPSLRCASPSSSTHSIEPWPDTDLLVVDEKQRQGRTSPVLQRQKAPETASTNARPVSFLAYTSIPKPLNHEENDSMYQEFIRDYPEYRLTWILDTLRRTDFSRLERNEETYVDYMGASLYPESLVRVHAEFLNNSILGNTHSVSNSSKLSLDCANEARQAVLAFFQAPPEYTVIFTANTTASLKLIGESYPFLGGSSYVLAMDSHNSVNGIREFATYRGARCAYIPSLSTGGFDIAVAKNTLLRHRPRNRELTPSLFALTAQSNVTNTKMPLSIAEYAKSLGYHVILDAAALVPTTSFSLAEHPVDAMAVSFYKMFGFPTGVGALIVKRSFLAELKRPWFSGGTVNIVQVPGNLVTLSKEEHEQFEDGTINYLTLPAIVDGLRFLTAYMPFLPLRLSCLLHYLISSLTRLRHDVNGAPLVQIYSKIPSRRVMTIGERAETGFMVSFLFFDPAGVMIPNSFIEYTASKQNISLRTGCVCNPGGTSSILGAIDDMSQLYPGVTLQEFERRVGRELGIVRVSLGLASDFKDIQRVIRFATALCNSQIRESLMDAWRKDRDASGSSH